MSPHRCANMVIDGVPIMVLLSMVHVIVACQLLSIVVDFILLFSIYIVFYFELADDTYSVRVPCTDPFLYFLPCHFVECSKRAIDFDSPSALASLQHIRVRGELLFLARAGFSPSRLDVFEFRTWTIFLLVSFS